MKNVLAGAIAAAAFATIAGAAHAERVCQWTGSVWACGDGNIFSEHYPLASGPNITITAVPTVVPTGQPPLIHDPRPY